MVATSSIYTTRIGWYRTQIKTTVVTVVFICGIEIQIIHAKSHSSSFQCTIPFIEARRRLAPKWIEKKNNIKSMETELYSE
jgi:hypothetical protein